MRTLSGWLVFAAALLAASLSVADFDVDLEFEGTYFPDSPLDPRQHGDTVSIAFQPEYVADWHDETVRLVVEGFGRWDSGDDERSHADLRQGYLRVSKDDVDVYFGVRQIYWGVTESRHLVDIINQIDLVENIDAEDKLGQPMISIRWPVFSGTAEVFVMPYFRERTYPGVAGRLRIPIVIDTDSATYGEGGSRYGPDIALRYQFVAGEFDVGFALFDGTDREPKFNVLTRTEGEQLAPLYVGVTQAALDVQWTHDSWLLKAEALGRDDEQEHSFASVVGFEYTYYGVFDSSIDVGLLGEYLFDDRSDRTITVFDDDMFFGVRVTPNDVAGTDLLIGTIIDVNNGTTFGTLEGSRRIGADWAASLEARWFANVDRSDPLFGFENDNYLRLAIKRFF